MKKFLAMVLALVMTMSLVTISSNAAFADADKIEHDEAVETLSALGVIAGMGDGNFAPEGNVTRAQMAKMITVITLGDVNVEAFKGITTDLTDINDWAEAYVKYCYSQGIIAGKGNGMFDGNANVTASEAAKMLLVAIGYNSDVQGYTGAQWQINVTRDAQISGFFKDVVAGANKALTRDEAAQMIYNAVQANSITKTPSLKLGTNEISYTYNADGDPLLVKTFGAITKYGYMNDVSYNTTKKEYTYSFVQNDVLSGDYKNTITAAADYTAGMGMKTKMIYKTENNKTTVYGIYAVGADKIVTALGDDITIGSGKVTIKKVDYKTANQIAVFCAGGSLGNLSAVKDEAFIYDLYDIDGDGKIELAVTVPFTVERATFVGKTSATIGGVSYEFEDIVSYDGMARNDIVKHIAAAAAADGIDAFSKIDKVTGKIAATKGNNNAFQVEGSWSKNAVNNVSLATLKVGNTADLYIVNGFVFYSEKVNGTSVSDILYVIASDDGTYAYGADITASLGTNKGVDTRVILPDGTVKIVKGMRVDVTSVNSGVSGADSDLQKVVAAAGLYTYKVNDDGVYELKAVKESTAGSATELATGNYEFAAANKPDDTTVTLGQSAGFARSNNNVASKLDGNLIADDAIIYMVDSRVGGKIKAISGKDLKGVSSWGSSTSYITTEVNGVDTVILAVITADVSLPGSDVTTGYGYITTAGYYTETADNKGRVVFTVWNGTEEVELTDVSSGITAASVSSYGKGAFVKYTVSTVDGEVNTVSAIGTQDAIKGYDGANTIDFATTGIKSLKSDNKTAIIYVDTLNVKGIEGGSIELAQKVAVSSYVKNAVLFDGDNDGNLEAVFIDVGNKLVGAGYTVGTVTASDDTTNGVTLSPAVKIDNSGTPTNLSSSGTVAAGKVITVSVTPSGAEGGTGDYSKTATVRMTRADGVVETKTMTFICAQNTAIDTTMQSVTFTMPSMDVTSIVVTFA